jgi:hypothetical protein
MSDGRPCLFAAGFGFLLLLGEYTSRGPGFSFCLYIEKAPREVLRNRLDVLFSLAQDAAPGLKRFPVRKTPCLMIASPAYLQEHGVPRVPQDLCTHTGLERIGDNFPSSGHILFRGEDRENFIFERNIFSESSISLINSAVQGQGITFEIPAELVVDEVSSGKLVQVLPGWHRKSLEKSVYIRIVRLRRKRRTHCEIHLVACGRREKAAFPAGSLRIQSFRGVFA